MKQDNLVRWNLYSEDKYGIIYKEILKVPNIWFFFEKCQDFLIVLCPQELIPIFLDLEMIVIQCRDRLNVLF